AGEGRTDREQVLLTRNINRGPLEERHASKVAPCCLNKVVFYARQRFRTGVPADVDTGERTDERLLSDLASGRGLPPTRPPALCLPGPVSRAPSGFGALADIGHGQA